MLVDFLIGVLSFIAIAATLAFSVWTYIDTKRKYSHEKFSERRKQEHKEARERFKKRTKLGKRND